MGVIANLKEMGGAADNGLTPIPTIASAAALAIPDDGSVFYISGSTGVTSMTGSLRPGRIITLIGAASASVAFTGATVTTIPGTVGQFFVPSLTLADADSATFRMTEVGSWVCIATANNV